MKFHCLQDLQFSPQIHYDKAGRPRKDDEPSRITSQIPATLVLKQAVVEVEMTTAGRFILATNVRDATKLSPDTALCEYKD